MMSEQQPSNGSASFQEEWLSAYLDDELSPQQVAVVEQQLRTNPHLQSVLEELRRVRSMVATLPAWQGDMQPVHLGAHALEAPRKQVVAEVVADEHATGEPRLMDESEVHGRDGGCPMRQIPTTDPRDSAEWAVHVQPARSSFGWGRLMAMAVCLLVLAGVGYGLWIGVGEPMQLSLSDLIPTSEFATPANRPESGRQHKEISEAELSRDGLPANSGLGVELNASEQSAAGSMPKLDWDNESMPQSRARALADSIASDHPPASSGDELQTRGAELPSDSGLADAAAFAPAVALPPTSPAADATNTFSARAPEMQAMQALRGGAHPSPLGGGTAEAAVGEQAVDLGLDQPQIPFEALSGSAVASVEMQIVQPVDHRYLVARSSNWEPTEIAMTLRAMQTAQASRASRAAAGRSSTQKSTLDSRVPLPEWIVARVEAPDDGFFRELVSSQPFLVEQTVADSAGEEGSAGASGGMASAGRFEAAAESVENSVASDAAEQIILLFVTRAQVQLLVESGGVRIANQLRITPVGQANARPTDRVVLQLNPH